MFVITLGSHLNHVYLFSSHDSEIILSPCLFMLKFFIDHWLFSTWWLLKEPFFVFCSFTAVETVQWCLPATARMLGLFRSSRTRWTHPSSWVCIHTAYQTSTSASSWPNPTCLWWYWCVHHCLDQQRFWSDSLIDGCTLAGWVVCTEWIDLSRWQFRTDVCCDKTVNKRLPSLVRNTE